MMCLRSRPVLVPMLLAAAFVAIGCAGGARGPQAAPEPARMIEPRVPGLTSAEEGLEVIVWTADDTDHRAARALAPLVAAEPAVSGTLAEDWQRIGLRLVLVPADQLETLLTACPPVSPLQRQRFGQLPFWTPIVRGPQLPPGTPGPGGRTLEPGRPRLIARSWIEPDLSTGQRREIVRTEFTLQIEHARRPLLMADPDTERSIADEGAVLGTLLATYAGTGTHALVLIAEDPEIDWAKLPQPASAAEPSSEDGASPTPAAPTPPVMPRQRALGEWMLSSPAIPARDGRPATPPRKVFVILLPRLRADAPDQRGPD